MFDKIVGSVAAALEGVVDGASILVGGFGGAGRPDHLLSGLYQRGIGDITIYSNNAGGATDVYGQLIRAGRVAKVVCSFPRSSDPDAAIYEAWRAGRIEVEVVPQGTLAERIRAGGAGIGAFFTPTGAGTALSAGKETREIGGVVHVLEHAIRADVALLHAQVADRWGNLSYRRAARNFNPVMATAARTSIVEVNDVSDGALDPEHVLTPGIFVDRVVKVDGVATRA